MAFIFNQCKKDGLEFPGLYEIEVKFFRDSRGYFCETYNERDFFEAGLCKKFVQENQSLSEKSVLRGLHFQKHHAQGKLVRALKGRVLDVTLDLRGDSPTFSRFYSVILDGEKQNQFYIPEGFAHGFLVLSQEAIFSYKCTDFYHPEDEGGILWNSSTLNINWNDFLDCDAPKLSEKDKNHPLFNAQKKYFDIDGKWCGD